MLIKIMPDSLTSDGYGHILDNKDICGRMSRGTGSSNGRQPGDTRQSSQAEAKRIRKQNKKTR